MFHKLKLRGRIRAGFIALLVITLLAGLVSHFGIKHLSGDIHAYENMAGDALLASELNADMAKAALYAGEYLRNPSDEMRQLSERYTSEVKSGIETARTEFSKPARVSLLDELDRKFALYLSSVSVDADVQQRSEASIRDLLQQGLRISEVAAQIKRSALADEHALAEDAKAAAIQTEILVALAVITAVIGGTLLAWIVPNGVSRPIWMLTQTMDKLAKGDLLVDIPGAERFDEIGDMARAVQVFKQNGIDRERLLDENEREQVARAERQKRVEELISNFEAAVRTLLSSAEDDVRKLGDTARDLKEVATGAVEKAGSVSAAAEQSSTNLRAVAAATEEMVASIEEITGKVEQTSASINSASHTARESNTRIARLAEESQHIGAIVSLITSITDKTNLLALNATIEAARAGEAGKGFAVVANEVKALASQTARATEDITKHIGGIQTTSKDAVASISEIATAMNDVESYASAIAAAIREQSTVMAEVSGNVHQAAAGSQQIAYDIVALNGVVQISTDSAKEAQNVSGNVERVTHDLRSTVEHFLGQVAAA